VSLNVACPDPGVCDVGAGQQLDAVTVGFSAGTSGMSDPGSETFNFSLILPGGSQATIDSITCDSSVAYALCGLGPEGPGTFFAGNIYFDAPAGSSYSQVNFRYISFNYSSQAVYTFTP
jgi:hypothetical protein